METDENKIFVIRVLFDGELVGLVRIVARDEAFALTEMYKRLKFEPGSLIEVQPQIQIAGAM